LLGNGAVNVDSLFIYCRSFIPSITVSYKLEIISVHIYIQQPVVLDVLELVNMHTVLN